MKYMRDTNKIYVIQSGAGQIAAAAATQLLICEVQPDLIVNFGVVGALTEAASHDRLYVVNGVVQYDFDTSCADNCELNGRCASVQRGGGTSACRPAHSAVQHAD